MDYESIGKSIGVTKTQVGTLLFRAKRLLREEVEVQASEPPAPERGSRTSRRKK